MPTAITDPVVVAAQAEMPEDFVALRDAPSFGGSLLTMKADLVLTRLIGVVPTADEQSDMDVRVIDYIGKMIALELINPAISYWNQAAVQITASGRAETKTFTNRVEVLKELRSYLLAQTREILADISPLLPSRQTQRFSSAPAIKNVTTGVTPNPDDFESPYDIPTTDVNGTRMAS